MQYIYERLNKIMTERDQGRKDCRDGKNPSEGRTDDYYVAYSEEYEKSQIADHRSEAQCTR